jgi:hypothetical protein
MWVSRILKTVTTLPGVAGCTGDWFTGHARSLRNLAAEGIDAGGHSGPGYYRCVRWCVTCLTSREVMSMSSRCC